MRDTCLKVRRVDVAAGQFWDNPYTYNFCSIEGTTGPTAAGLTEQAHMLRYGQSSVPTVVLVESGKTMYFERTC